MIKKAALVVCLVETFFVSAAGQTPDLKPAAESPSEAFSESIRAVLKGPACELWVESKLTARFWMRSPIPTAENENLDLGVSFGRLKEGTLVGAVELLGVWADYKGNPVAPGRYTMRYGLQPADGNHMGVSIYRDYLLLIPAQQDADPEAEFDHDTTVQMSKQVTPAVNHPAVLALFPVYDEVTEARLEKNDMDQWMIALPAGDLLLGLTVIGQGEH